MVRWAAMMVSDFGPVVGRAVYDPATLHGRQGIVEFRAFEMPPNERMAAAQMLLVRAMVAVFSRERYVAPLVRWGSQLHDRFMLPHHLWSDLQCVLEHFAARGGALDVARARPGDEYGDASEGHPLHRSVRRP